MKGEPVAVLAEAGKRAQCICGNSVLPQNWANHLLSQKGRHGPAITLDAAWLPETPATAAGRALLERHFPFSGDLGEPIDPQALSEAIREIEAEVVAPLLALDLHCESFIGVPGNPAQPVYDDCIKYGRQIKAQYADDQACWPCIIRALLASEGSEP